MAQLTALMIYTRSTRDVQSRTTAATPQKNSSSTSYCAAETNAQAVQVTGAEKRESEARAAEKAKAQQQKEEEEAITGAAAQEVQAQRATAKNDELRLSSTC